MSEWLFNRGTLQNGMTHNRARNLIQKDQLSVQERAKLSEHLSSCEECSRYAALHVYLFHHLQLEPVRAAISPELRISLINSIRSQNRRTQIMKPIYAVAGVVILAIIVVGAWLAIGSLAKQDEPLADVVETSETSAPTAEPVETHPSVIDETAVSTAASPAETAVPPTTQLEPTAAPPMSYKEYEVGDELFDIAVVDFNADGFPDLAVADYNPGQNFTRGATQVLLNDGSGSFLAPTSYDTGEASITLSAADLNGDSYVDLAVTGGSADILSVLINKGDGTFEVPVNYATDPNPSWVQAGDIDGDSYSDLIITNGLDLVGVMFNNGDGTFRESIQYFAGKRAGTGSAYAGDLDGDGDLDIAVRQAPDGLVSVLMNGGDGTLGEPEEYETCLRPINLRLGDLNQDEALDLIVPCEIGIVSILLNNGDGSFQQSTNIESSENLNDLQIVEMNGDGLQDLLISPTSNGLLTSYFNNGDGTFQHMKDYPFQDYPDLYTLNAFHVTDIDGDGLRDIVGISGGPRIVVFPLDSTE